MTSGVEPKPIPSASLELPDSPEVRQDVGLARLLERLREALQGLQAYFEEGSPSSGDSPSLTERQIELSDGLESHPLPSLEAVAQMLRTQCREVPPITRSQVEGLLREIPATIFEPSPVGGKRVQTSFEALLATCPSISDDGSLRQLESLLGQVMGIQKLEMGRNRFFSARALLLLVPKLAGLREVTLASYGQQTPLSLNSRTRDTCCLCGLKNSKACLHTLRVGACRKDKFLEALAEHPEIQRLELSDFPGMTDDDLRGIADLLPNLQWLRIRACPDISGRGLRTLAEKVSLEVLDLSNLGQFKPEDWQGIPERVPNLRGLILEEVGGLSSSLANRFLEAAPRLHAFVCRVRCALSNGSFFQKAPVHDGLRILGVALAEGQLTGRGLLNWIQRLPQLRHLSVLVDDRSTKIFRQARRLELFEQLRELKSLHLEHVHHLSEEELRELCQRLPELKLLSLQCCGKWWEADEECNLNFLKGSLLSPDVFPGLFTESGPSTSYLQRLLEAELQHELDFPA